MAAEAKLGEVCPAAAPKSTAFWWWDCPVYLCGNSAKIYGSEVEALDTRGREPQSLAKPFSLVRGSLRDATGGCAGVANLSLASRNGVLVGVLGDDLAEQVKCTGEELAGARFTMKYRDPMGMKNVDIRIVTVGAIETYPVAGQSETLPTYDLEAEGPDGGPLCQKKTRWDTGLVIDAGVPQSWAKPSTHALIIQGETYKKDATTDKSGPNWINLGCAGSGIAKLRLLGMDPMNASSSTTAHQRVATLKMLTGKYCGEKSWTLDGTRIAIRLAGVTPPPTPDHPANDVGPIESQWSERGATCLSHLRLWYVDSPCAKETEQAALEEIRAKCGISDCAQNCDDPLPPGRPDVWRTCTVRHVPDSGP